MSNRPLFIWVIVFGLAISSCQKGNVYLDNPGKSDLLVRIGAQNWQVKANSGKTVNVEPGSYDLHVQNVQNIDLGSDKIRIHSGGLLNLGKIQYVVWRDLYGAQTLREKELNEDLIKIDGKDYYGDLTLIGEDSLFIECSWDYNPDEAFPMKKFTLDRPDKQEYFVKSKIFRKDDFVNAYVSISLSD